LPARFPWSSSSSHGNCAQDWVSALVLSLKTAHTHVDGTVAIDCCFVQDYKQRRHRLDPDRRSFSARLVRIWSAQKYSEQSVVEWIYVRVHDTVVDAAQGLMQMEAGGSLPTFQPMTDLQ